MDDPHDTPETPKNPPTYCTVGGILARLEVWTEAQWEARAGDTLPIAAEHVPGLGWLVALAVLSLN